MMGLDAGELDRRVTFYRRPVDDDGFSSSPGAPVEAGKRWAKKTDIGDAERISAAAQQQVVSTRFLLRYDGLTRQIAPEWQMVCDGLRYEVVGIKEVRGTRVAVEITTSALRS
ncbi:head-tail adaptor protein [Sphingomonas corticis]|uniref:Head-tail adaptor protein n=1 Tax=Sphingomonas corticis TaxID=2722791 RepID=A0ABX1CU19_9SPHN|nr:head-tail adaptor protein [Sphingomonas corticis]NJR80453.1 head-tail adaptor protein [Sphingomonas corticis]